MYPHNNELQEVRSNSYKVEVAVGDGLYAEVACLYATVRKRYVTHMDRMMGRKFLEKLKQMSFCSFQHDFEEKLRVRVTPNAPFTSYCIRPFGGMHARVGNSIEFELIEPTKISIEIDGNIYENLFIFAEEQETEKPCPTDDNVIYFGKGVHHIDVIELKENQTLYLEAGAFVYSRVFAENVKNIKTTRLNEKISQ